MLLKLLYAGIVATIFGTDYTIKDKIEKGNKTCKIPGVTITRYHNYGACRNLGDKKPIVIKTISLLLTFALTGVYIVTLGKLGKNLLKIGLSFLLGGAFSNTYDRLSRGYVVDYLRFKTPWKWLNDMIFNISDFFIIIGALLAGISI